GGGRPDRVGGGGDLRRARAVPHRTRAPRSVSRPGGPVRGGAAARAPPAPPAGGQQSAPAGRPRRHRRAGVLGGVRPADLRPQLPRRPVRADRRSVLTGAGCGGAGRGASGGDGRRAGAAGQEPDRAPLPRRPGGPGGSGRPAGGAGRRGRVRLTRRDVRTVEAAIAERGAGARAWVTYGTAELAVRRLARAWPERSARTPGVRVAYAYPENREAIPRYEGQALDRTVTSHIATAGGRRVTRGEELILFVHNFPGAQEEAPHQEPYEPRSLDHFFEALRAGLEGGSTVGIADVRYSNGADRTFVRRLLDLPGASR